MKKLLSICFLSILLGLLSFSAQAQNCGFIIKNLQPDTIEGVVQMSPDGLLPLDHTLGSGVFINPENPYDYYGNANVGRTELYELFLCNTCNLAPKTKVSLDWILQRQDENGNWVTVNDNLSYYVDFDIYTLYAEINDTTGACNRITWLGGRVPNGFGYCEQAVAPDMFHGITCNTPTNYPGAVPVGQGTPYSVVNQLGQLIPAMGMTPIYTEALDYFYYDFFSQTRTLVQLKWKAAGKYRLIMNLRERVGGTAWNNLTWNENETTDFIGGHQSCCGEILSSDTIAYPVFGEYSKEVCQNETWTFGQPPYTFSVTTEDTLVAFNRTLNPNSDCAITQTDSLYRVHFFVRHTPVVQAEDAVLCKCAEFTVDDLLDLVTMDEDGLDDTQCTPHFQWYYNNTWNDTPPALTNLNVPGDNYFTIRQINTYNDTLDCIGDSLTFKVTFKEMTPPEINTPELTDFCLEALNGATLTLSAELDEECANTVRWYTAFDLPLRKMAFQWLQAGTLPAENYFSTYLDPESYIGSNELTINLADYMPSTNKDTVLYFFAVSYEDTTCPSPLFSYITINLHQTPVLTKSETKDVYCVSDEVVMTATVSTTQTDQPYTFNWTGFTAIDVDGEHVATDKKVVEITGTVQNNGRMPVNVSKSRNYSQQIFTSEEVDAGTITKMAFKVSNSTNKKTANVEIYLGTTDKNSFESKADFVTSNLQLVYTGGLNSTAAGWKELNFTTPYNYNGQKNLVLVVKDNSNQSQDNKYFACSQTEDYMSMIIATDGTLPADPTSYTGTVNRYQYRSDVKFTVIPAIDTNAQTVYNELNPQNECGHAYSTSVYVVDANGCTSAPVQFDYTGNDTLAPVVTPAARVTRVEGCNVNENNDVLFETLADFDQAGIEVTDDAVEIGDACGLPYLTFTHADTHLAGPCEDTIIRVYTFTDKCGKTATFTDSIISRDNQKPIFLDPVTNQSPYIRMIPVRGQNCTYNAPEKPAFVHAILGVVSDNCTTMDSLWLMDHATFYWENSEMFDQVLAPGTLDIFGPQVGNQLTVKVVVEDACGNADTAMILYFNRPDTLTIDNPAITVVPANICVGESATLTFLPNKVHFDPDFTMTPLSYQWSNKENEVEFSDTNALVTTVTPTVGDRTYSFRVTVTDTFGCQVTSDYAQLFVKANPRVKIVKDIRNGATEPYCPTYGVMTIEAIDSVTGTKIPHLTYTWSGESVNVNESIEDTSFISIIPVLCEHIYTANVHVQDTIYGCEADASIDVWVADQTGPVYSGDVINYTVERQDSCKMYIPDFIQYLNNANISDNCYPFSAMTFRQDPPANTLMTEDTQVTIYVTTPCDTNEYAISGKFNALVPDNRLKVTAAAVPTEHCEPATFQLTATPIKGVGTITYSWTKLNSTWTDEGQSVPSEQEYVNEGAASTTYTYNVKAVDALLCEATASVDVTVFKTIMDIDTATIPNTNCLAPWNGQFIVFHAPIHTTYELTRPDGFYMYRVSEVPGWDTNVTENTLIFDYLQAADDYILTVTTPNGCVSTFEPIKIRDLFPTITFNNDFTMIDPTFCTNNNGVITFDNAEPGYTYQVSRNGVVVTDLTHLTPGWYTITKTSLTNRCSGSVDTLMHESTTSMEFAVSTEGNTKCVTPYNGMIILESGWTYTVRENSATGSLVPSGNYSKLYEGEYWIHGVHNTTGCTHDTTVNVAINHTNPVFTVTTTPNHYCSNTTFDGSISVNPAQGYTYKLYKKNNTTNTLQSNWNILAAGDYYVTAEDANGCISRIDTIITNDINYPTVADTTTENTSCNIAVNPYNGTATIIIKDNDSIFNGYIKNYKVNFNNQNYNNIDSKTKTFTGLNHGTYNYTVTSKYLCSVSGSVTVAQHEYPALAMHATPNTMCVGTFEHPGNGTIVMDSVKKENGYVYYRDTIFDYSYYYAQYNEVTGKYEAGSQLQVNYFDPLSYTMYHLIDSIYYVVVYDRLNGCDVTGTITVPLGRDNVVAEADGTPNKNCQAPYDGTVTVSATAYKLNTELFNVDAVLAYQLVGETNNYTTAYQLSPNFTGVPDGTYTVNVKDTTTGCVYPFEGAVTVEKTPSDIVLTPTITPNHACEVQGGTTPWDGTLTVVASSEMFANAQFVYSINNGEFSTVNTWTNLAPAKYHVVVKDLVSGCEAEEDFTITTDNICAPNVTFQSFNHNNKEFHFCLNTQDAMICASATSNSECPATEYSYQWHVDCHDLSYTGSCINIPTDEVHCCTYTVTVTSLATGCQTVAPITVCIDRIHTIDYLVNGFPFLENPRIVRNCVNEDIEIGIVHNGWADAWWTNAHTTPRPGEPEYEFIVAANSTKTDTMYSYCVNVVDTNGCPATGVINLISKPLPTVTVYDTACTMFSIDNETFVYEDGTPDADYNVHFEYQEVTPKAGSNGCDSITIHKITLLGEPTITGTLPSGFCAGTTVQSILNRLTITNAIDTVVYINGVHAPKTAVLTYSECSQLNMTVIAFSGSYSVSDDHVSCSTGENYSFVVNAAPVFTEDLVLEPYCADGETREKAVPGHNCNICNSNDPVQTGCSLRLDVLNPNETHTVYEELGAVNGPVFTFVPKAEYDGKLLALTLSNSCGSITTFDTLHIDATTIHIEDVTICEGLPLDIDAILGKHYNNVTTYLLQPVAIGGSTTHDVEYQEIVYNGEPMIPEYNGYGLYFVVDNGICDAIVTDTATITVNPLPVLEIGDIESDLCYDNAAADLADAIETHEFASQEGWLVPNEGGWTEGFEGGVIPSTWTVITNGEGDGWYVQSVEDGTIHGGYYASTSASYVNYQGAVHADNWLFTPAINVVSGMSLSYYVCEQDESGDWNDSYSVYVLNSNTVDPTATPVISEQAIERPNWLYRTIDLTPYAGQTVYVAFQHEDYDNYRLVLDDVTLNAGYQKYTTAAALVEAIKNNTSYTDVYYYVKNDCGADTQYVGNFRILFPLIIGGGNVTVCPDATLADVTNQFTPSITLGNYSINEVDVYYTVGTGDQAVVLTDNDELADYGVTSGSTITVNVAPVDVKDCGAASAPVTVTFLTEEPVEPTFKPACSGSALSAFIATQPGWNTTNAEHPMSLLDPDESYWQVYDATIHTVDPDEYVVDAEYADQVDGIWVRYVWVTECGETVGDWYEGLIINDVPEITNLVNEIDGCAGVTVEESELNLDVLYHGNEDSYSTVYTLDGEEINFPYQFTTPGQYTLRVTINDNPAACGSTYEEVPVTIYEIPVPEITGPAKACSGETVTFTATAGYESYEFTLTGNYDAESIVQNDNELSVTVYADGVEFTTATVTVFDGHCYGTAAEEASVRVTNMPEFIFYDSTAIATGNLVSENETHYFTTNTGEGLQYIWMVGNECYDPDQLVYVEYDVYFNGRRLTNDSIDKVYFQPYTYNYHGQSPKWISSNQIYWNSQDGTPKTDIAYYDYAIGDPSIVHNFNEYGGNHYPNTNLGFTNSNVYDDLWMHFLAERPVTKTWTPFMKEGEYKIVYRLYATSNVNQYMHEYTHYYEDGTTATLHLGGSNANSNDPVITLLAIDSIIVDVNGPDQTVSTVNENELPILSPEISMTETAVAPDMEVWPNPAPAVTTTLKARVHNLAGNATVTLTTLTGKQVYAGKIYIDNDNYYFEFNVNSLAVGSYIMTVRTDTDIITKKVIVTTLAR